MSAVIEHDSHIIEDGRLWRRISASDIFEEAGGIILERTDKKLTIVRISYKTVRDLCLEHRLDYVGPVYSHDVYYSLSIRAKDVTPKGPE